MEKRNPEEVAKDLENIDFAEIEDNELREIFGSLGSEPEADCGNSGCGTNEGCIPPPI